MHYLFYFQIFLILICWSIIAAGDDERADDEIIDYTFYDLKNFKSCRNILIQTNVSGFIHSPNYLQSNRDQKDNNYEITNNDICDWTLKAPIGHFFEIM
jgi:hypothetical protein